MNNEDINGQNPPEWAQLLLSKIQEISERLQVIEAVIPGDSPFSKEIDSFQALKKAALEKCCYIRGDTREQNLKHRQPSPPDPTTHNTEKVKETETIHCGATLQNGNMENSIPDDKKKGLYGNYMLGRLVSAYTYNKNIKEVPLFPRRKKNFLIQDTHVWIIKQPMNLYKGPQTSYKLGKGNDNKDVKLPG
ncbi:hypothetical protein BB560_004589 [Smittium megazygosporum]|uniref:Uncharacterized protein n=1 Tax=Smittium megazygosporum TaxID=133381 RepID=A0A2T9Z8V2_9FUNG|nr:hypothetical protein BB560_004589 [Smittium megazygosporum]